MLSHVVENVNIAGVVTCVPPLLVDNNSFAGRFDQSVIQNVERMVGVKVRHHVDPSITASDLCQSAAERLLDLLGWTGDSIDALIFVSQTADHVMPATACILQHKLRLSTNTAAFDVNQGCSGYVYGLWLAACLIAGGNRRVLLLAGDTISRLTNPEDKSTAMLFGDAGSATAIECKIGVKRAWFKLGTDGSGAASLIVPLGARSAQNGLIDNRTIRMNGSDVFGFTLSAVPDLIKSTAQVAGFNIDQFDYFVLHQANRFIIQNVVRKAALNPQRVPINIDRYGNTSSASIPLVLTGEIREHLLAEPKLVMLVGFGVGFSWGSCAITLENMRCLETRIH